MFSSHESHTTSVQINGKAKFFSLLKTLSKYEQSISLEIRHFFIAYFLGEILKLSAVVLKVHIQLATVTNLLTRVTTKQNLSI